MTKKKAASQKTIETTKVNSENTGDLTGLKAKLKKKYHLLQDSDLDTDDRDELLNRVCQVTGMYRNQLDVVLQDL